MARVPSQRGQLGRCRHGSSWVAACWYGFYTGRRAEFSGLVNDCMDVRRAVRGDTTWNDFRECERSAGRTMTRRYGPDWADE